MPTSYKEDSRPAQQWYWDDWFAEFSLRTCSLEARGLWADMLGIMWKAKPRGTLTANGRQIDNKSLAKIVNATIKTVSKCLAELERNNVFSRLEDGTIICRRTYREAQQKKKDEDLRKKRSKAGQEGAKRRWQKDGKRNSKSMAKMAASSSSSSSTSSSKNKEKDIKSENSKFNMAFEELWKSWPSGDRGGKKKHCRMKFVALCKAGKLEEFKKTTQGYSDFLRHKKEVENFPQRAVNISTWLNNWEEDQELYSGFKYEPRL